MERGGEQQITVIAHYTNGVTEDVTRSALYEANDPEMAEATVTGLVKTLDLTGDVAIMARYQGQVGVFRASIPLGVKVDSLPAPKNLVDEAVFKKLAVLGVPPSAVCDDSTFLRRSAVDIAGRLPDAGRNASVPGRQRSQQAGQLDRHPAGQLGLCRLLRQQVERHPAEQGWPEPLDAGQLLPSTPGFATPCTTTGPTTSSSAKCWPPPASWATIRRSSGTAR